MKPPPINPVEVLAAVLLVTGVCLARGEEVPGRSRLAIVSENPSLGLIADLVTVELGAVPSLDLVERDQVEKVRDEQQRAAANSTLLSLGRLLGADGVLLLRGSPGSTNSPLQATLLAVRAGVVVGAVRPPWSEGDPQGSARWLVRRLAPLWPKLQTLRRDTMALTVMDFRSAVHSREGIELEKQVTTGCIERLVHEPRLFVLERRRLDLLAEEKELQLDDGGFWAGSYLLEGTIDRDGYNPERLTIDARLVPPGGAKPLELKTTGLRSRPADVARDLASQVRRLLSLAPGKQEETTWDPQAEGAELAGQAAWALKWDLLDDARAAADAAWALGKQDTEGATVRIKSHLALALPDTGGIQIAQSTDQTRNFGPEEQVLKMGIRGHTIWASKGNVTWSETVREHPDPLKIDAARELLDLYRFLSQRLSADSLAATNEWFLLGCDVLECASVTLQHFNLVPQAQAAVSDKLAQLRLDARSMAAWLQASPAGKDTAWRLGRQGTHAEMLKWGMGGEVRSVQLCSARWGRFWQERPEDTLELYRRLLRFPPLWGPLRGKFLAFKFEEIPSLTAWQAPDIQRLGGLWTAFVEEVRHTMPPPLQAPTRPSPDPAASNAFFLSAQAARSNVWRQVYSNRPAGPPVLSAGSDSAGVSRPAPQPPPVTNALVVTNFFAVPTEKLRTGQDREVLSEWTTVAHQIYDGHLWLYLRYRQGYSQNFQTANGWGGRWVQTNLAATVMVDPRAGAVELFRHPPAPSVDPWQPILSQPGARTLPRGISTDFGDPILERMIVYRGGLFIAGCDYFRRCDLTTRRWETKPAPWQVPPVLAAVGSKLYGGNADMIFEVTEWPDKIRVLASCRRRPAATLLDSLETFDFVQFCPGPDDSLRVFVSGKGYTWQQQDWLPIPTLTNCLSVQFDARAAYIKCGQSGTVDGLWSLPHNSATPELCLGSVGPRRRGLLLPGASEPPSQAKWALPNDFGDRQFATARLDDYFLVLIDRTISAPGRPGAGKDLNGRHADLLCYPLDAKDPIVLPLKLSAPNGEVVVDPLVRFSPYPPVWMEVLGDWLVLGQSKCPGVWGVPQAELRAAIAEEKIRPADGRPRSTSGL